uniref:TASOR pseudo-PARP domain-containing protein n=3 Tax=Schistocephalus solidus TaxID=70667 RepID=A0A0X3PEW2_SCHSO
MPQKSQTNSQPLSSEVLVRKSIGSLRVPKKAVNESLLECVPVDSIDYTDEIEPHLRNNYRFRRLSSEAIHVDKAWLVHNRKLDDAFGNARKRLVKGDGFGRTQNVAVSVRTGFVFTDKWENVENVASEGLKPGNLPTTWLGKPNAGATVSQCVDISLAYLSSSRASAQKKTKSRRETLDTLDGDPPFFVILVRWLKGRVYIAPSIAPSESHGDNGVLDSRLDPQPGYTCHMTKWTRMDPLDPAKMTLEEAFQISQVYLYEYNDEMELLDTPEHIVPFAVVSCRWKPPSSGFIASDAGVNDASIIKNSHQYDPNDGAILLSKQSKVLRSATSFSSDHSHALSTAYDSDSPPSWPSALRRQNLSPSMPTRNKRSLLGNPSPSLLPTPTTAILNSQCDSRSISKRNGILPLPSAQPIAAQSRGIFERLHFEPDSYHSENRLFRSSYQPDAAVLSGRALQLAVGQSERIGVQPCHPSSDGHQRYIVNCCNLVWPIRSEGSDVQLWQLPLEIISYRHPGFSVYEGILQPRFLITGLVSLTKLHYELAGLEEPSSEENLDPRTKTKLAVCPYVSIDRLREWTIPGVDKCENRSKPGRYTGYWGNYFLFTLPDLTTQRCEVARLCETLRAKQFACVIRMPCNSNAALFIFPDSDFSRSLGIPQLDSLESDSFHGILLLPHSLNMTYGNKCHCKQSSKLADPVDPVEMRKTIESQSDLVGVNIIALSSLVAALPDGGKGLLRKTVSLMSDGKDNKEAVEHEFISARQILDVSKSRPAPKQEVPTQLPSKGVDHSKNLVESLSKDFSSALLHTDYSGSKDNDQFVPTSSVSPELKKQEPGPSVKRQAFDVASRTGPACYIDLSDDSPEKAQSTLHISSSPRSMSISPEKEVISAPLPSTNPVQVDDFVRFDGPEDPATRQLSPAKSSDMDLDSSCDSAGSTPKKVSESVLKKSNKLCYDDHPSPLASSDPDRGRPLAILQPHVPPAPEKYSPLSFTDTLIKQGNIARNIYSTPIKSPLVKAASPNSIKRTVDKPTLVLGNFCATAKASSSLNSPKSVINDIGGPGVSVAFGQEGPNCRGRIGQEAPPCKALFGRKSPPQRDADFNTDAKRSQPRRMRSRSPQFSSQLPPPKRSVTELPTIGHTSVADLRGPDSVLPIKGLKGSTAPVPYSDTVFSPTSHVPTPPGNSRLPNQGRSISVENGPNRSPYWKGDEMITTPSTVNSLLMPSLSVVQSTAEDSMDKPLGFADIDARVLPPVFYDSIVTPAKEKHNTGKFEELLNPTQNHDPGSRVPQLRSISLTPSPLASKGTVLKDFDARSDRQDFGTSLRSPHSISASSDGALFTSMPPLGLSDFSKPPSVDVDRPDFRALPPSHVTTGSLLPSPAQDRVQSPKPAVPPNPGSASDPQYGEPKREEEEGEIVDDDEDPAEDGAEDSVESIDMDLGDPSFGDADNESLTSYSLSPSPVKQGKRFQLPPRKKSEYFDYRRARERERLLQPYDPSSVDRVRNPEKLRRTSYRPSMQLPEQDFDELRYSTSGFQPGYRDVDYRFPAQTHASSFEGSTDTDFSENGDRDYRVSRGPSTPSYSATSMGAQGRYQVYVPKSAEAVSMPVKVINHAHVDKWPSSTDRSRRNPVDLRNFKRDMGLQSPNQPQKPVALLADPTSSPQHSSSSAFSTHRRKEASQVMPRLRCSVTVPLMGEPPISTPRFLPPSILPINPVSVAIGRPGLYIQSHQPLIGIPGLATSPVNNPLTALNQAALLPYYASIFNCPNPSWGCGRK